MDLKMKDYISDNTNIKPKNVSAINTDTDGDRK